MGQSVGEVREACSGRIGQQLKCLVRVVVDIHVVEREKVFVQRGIGREAVLLFLKVCQGEGDSIIRAGRCFVAASHLHQVNDRQQLRRLNLVGIG